MKAGSYSRACRQSPECVVQSARKVQRFMTAFDEKHAQLVDALGARFAGIPGPLLPLLHAVQDELGFIPPEAVPRIASVLNLSRAEVHGVISFYHYFRQHAPGRHVVQICRAEACQAMNCEATEAHAKRCLGVD